MRQHLGNPLALVPKALRDLKHRVFGIPWFEVEPRDRFIASWPRSGNTWVRNLLASVLFGRDLPDMDFLNRAIPTLDYLDFRACLAALPADRPRVIKTHELPFRGTERARSVYLVRHPVDAMVSWYHMRRSHRQTSAAIDPFARAVVAGRVRYGSWHPHVGAWLDPAAGDGVLVVRYEDLAADPPKALATICRHFGLEAGPEVVERAVRGATVEGVAARFAEWSRRRGNEFTGSVAAAAEKPKLSVESIRLIESRSAPLMERLGYPSRLA
jgi:hypothetical protein